jgi:hypothetical protein
MKDIVLENDLAVRVEDQAAARADRLPDDACAFAHAVAPLLSPASRATSPAPRLFRLQSSYRALKLALGLQLDLEHKIAADVGIQNLRADVALAANGRSIAQPRRHLLDCASKIMLCLRGAVEAINFGEDPGRQAVPPKCGNPSSLTSADLTSR